jgi:hypothetical protein
MKLVKLLPEWQKESWQTFEETSGHVRPEQVKKWPNSMTYMMMIDEINTDWAVIRCYDLYILL